MSRHKSMVVLMVVFAIITFHVIWSKRQDKAAALLGGRYTAQQMIDLSLPICRAMLPNRADLYVRAEQVNPITRPGHVAQIFWEVCYMDGTGEPLLDVIRNAETGEVWRTNTFANSRDAPGNAASTLSAVSAVARARFWMRTLGFQESWQVVGRPKRQTTRWYMILCTADRRAIMTIDRQQGYLIDVELNAPLAK